MSVREIGLLACALCALIAIGRMALLLSWRRPVLARILSTDYSECEQDYDRDFRRFHLVDNRLTTADIPFRSILVRARYQWDGVEYAEDVPVYARKGDPPDRQIILWLDPRRPTRVTSRGIGVAALWLLGIGAFAFAFWRLPF